MLVIVKKDRPIVQRFCHSLTEKGVQLHADYEQLVGGEFAQELTKQIESADAILFFYSENTENSMWVKHEIEFSLSKNKCIIPLLLSEPEEINKLTRKLIEQYCAENKISESVLYETNEVDDARRMLYSYIERNERIMWFSF